jgi:hypothetical protein
MKRAGLIMLTVSVAGCLGFALACSAGIITRPYIGYGKVWTVAVCELDRPFDGHPIEMRSVQLITAEHVTDTDARFVADPFMIRNDGQWCLFYEVLNGDTNEGDIGLSTSPDGRNWTYQRIVLDEDFHLSYPQVVQHDGEFYMVPECSAAGEVRLYRATRFPTEWKHERTLLETPLVDATLLQHGGRWWMFGSPRSKWGELRLYSADDLTSSDWVEHPQSPIVTGSARFSRPGGRILERGDKLFRLAQDHKLRYGHQLWSLEITKLTMDEYLETPTSVEPILTAAGNGWNAIGMHHMDLHITDEGKRLACVDGLQRVLIVGPITLGR